MKLVFVLSATKIRERSIGMTTTTHLWLRAETKPNEKRTAIPPNAAKELVSKGFKVTIETSDQSIFASEEYAGFDLVPAGSWKTDAPKDAFVVGVKELPETDTFPLTHKHIMFAHCFKYQDGWKNILKRFDQGQGTLFDLEFLNDDQGRRVAAFGYYAGFAGAALGIDTWCHKKLSKTPYASVKPFSRVEDLIAYIKDRLTKAMAAAGGEYPSVMVMGALGRCGTGATDLATKVGIPS